MVTLGGGAHFLAALLESLETVTRNFGYFSHAFGALPSQNSGNRGQRWINTGQCRRTGATEEKRRLGSSGAILHWCHWTDSPTELVVHKQPRTAQLDRGPHFYKTRKLRQIGQTFYIFHHWGGGGGTWRHSSVVRTSVSGWRTFLDLWLACDHFSG